MSFQILWRVYPPRNTHTHIVKSSVQIKNGDLTLTPVGLLSLFAFSSAHQIFAVVSIVWSVTISPLQFSIVPDYFWSVSLLQSWFGNVLHHSQTVKIKTSTLKSPRFLFQTTLHWFSQLPRRLGDWRVHGGPGGAAPGLWWAWPAGAVWWSWWSPGPPGCHCGDRQLPPGPERGRMQAGWWRLRNTKVCSCNDCSFAGQAGLLCQWLQLPGPRAHHVHILCESKHLKHPLNVYLACSSKLIVIVMATVITFDTSQIYLQSSQISLSNPKILWLTLAWGLWITVSTFFSQSRPPDFRDDALILVSIPGYWSRLSHPHRLSKQRSDGPTNRQQSNQGANRPAP